MSQIVVALNICSLILVSAAVFFAIRRIIRAHMICIGLGVLVSVLLLGVFLYDKIFLSGLSLMPKGDATLFFIGFLISHITASVIVLPMIAFTINYALRQKWDKHRALARWTASVWFYSSLTGVLLYVIYMP